MAADELAGTDNAGLQAVGSMHSTAATEPSRLLAAPWTWLDRLPETWPLAEPAAPVVQPSGAPVWLAKYGAIRKPSSPAPIK